MTEKKKSVLTWGVLGAIVVAGVLAGRCAPSGPKGKKAPASSSDISVAAQKTYVAPGDLDEYYFFASGGHSGQMYVYGVPSMRHLSTIPVFTPYPATGYGFDDESKAMLGGLTWGDAHHPALSETAGDYDGRWLFINDMNARIARIDLRDFKTKQILGPVANVSGNHACAFVTPNTEYAMMALALLDARPEGDRRRDRQVRRPSTRASSRRSRSTRSRARCPSACEILTPPFDWDLGDAGKKVSDGWMFWTCYNSERATGKLEVTASQADRDYIAAVDWKAAEKADRRGQGRHDRRRQGPRPEEGAGHHLPDAVRQVAPRGRRLPRRQVHHRLRQAPGRHDRLQLREGPDGDPQQGLHGRRGRDPGPEVRVDQGRRGRGRPRPAPHPVRRRTATPTRRSSSTPPIAKWKLGTWEVVDKIPMSYSIGHLCAAEGDTVQPGRASTSSASTSSRTAGTCNVGPSQPESSQLVDISEEKMKLLYDAFTEPEPHYASMIKADKLKPIEVYPKEENKHPLAIWDVKDAGVTRKGTEVLAKVVLVRSTITPDRASR